VLALSIDPFEWVVRWVWSIEIGIRPHIKEANLLYGMPGLGESRAGLRPDPAVFADVFVPEIDCPLRAS
jgi:hypothetical protein